MLKIAIVEDDQTAADRLQEFFIQYTDQNGEAFNVTVFSDAVQFLNNYQPVFDMVFMDIELPYINGMEAAQRLRQMDQKILLIFVTNMAQFAVKGYEVNALYYIVKPIRYNDFEWKLRRAVNQCKAVSDSIFVVQQNETKRILLQDIYYVEVRNHKLIYHTQLGEIVGGGTLTDIEEKLKGKGFLRGNKWYLANQRHIASIQGNVLIMTGGDALPLSRPRKKIFMDELAEYMGNENIL